MFASVNIATLIETLTAADPAVLGPEAVLRCSEQVARLRGWLDHLEAGLARRADELAADRKGLGAEETLRKAGSLSTTDAGRRARRAKTLEEARPMADALRNGEVSAEHVDVLTNAARALPEEERGALFQQAERVTEKAKRTDPSRFRRWLGGVARQLTDDEGESRLAKQKRDARLRRWIDRRTGMYMIEGRFDPETGAKAWKSIDDRADSRAQQLGTSRGEQNDAHALADLLRFGRQVKEPAPNVAEIEVLIDVETVEGGLHESSISELYDGTPLPPETIRRLCCNAVLAPTLIGSDGQVLAIGRQQRTANRAQRRALRAMYPTCAWEGCDRPFHWCEIHHIIPWERGGPTDLDNLLPLCTEHHHAVHEGGWSVELGGGRRLSIGAPDGRVVATIELPSAERSRRIAARRRLESEQAWSELRRLDPGRWRPPSRRAVPGQPASTSTNAVHRQVKTVSPDLVTSP